MSTPDTHPHPVTMNNDSPFVHHEPKSLSDRVALNFVKFLRLFADAFFSNRYGNRAVVLETVAAVPGMVGGAMLHLKSLRRMEDDQGWIKTLLDEAANERMHLMTFIHIAQPTRLERWLVLAAQCVFYVMFLVIYLCSYRTAHRVVGYLEEEAVVSYTQYLASVDSGDIENVPAPDIAKEYWALPSDARLRDVIIAIRADEMQHREVNHCIADKITGHDCSITVSDEVSKKDRETLSDYAERLAP